MYYGVLLYIRNITIYSEILQQNYSEEYSKEEKINIITWTETPDLVTLDDDCD